ncbi:hypothetical protein ACH4TX_03405 [Streptomyces sp. NPDC021098]|uniref:hypothetical protein n=1 Tax=unclassified Streptomyces TaxID=2593676 RepID=UPI0037BD62C8
MTTGRRSGLRAAVAAASIAALGLIAPQAVAADTPQSGVKVSARADTATRTIAAQKPQTVRVMANLCGSGYELYSAERLPDERRYGTLFIYVKGGTGPNNYACTLFDNNQDGARYMKLKICENKTSNPRCQTDEGSFTQYAGPVRMDNCPQITAIMKNGNGKAIIDAVRGPFCG